jgi:glutathione-specific gamma-glutamylcyclotransferase
MALWVFGYGSLLWNPGFVPRETVKARLVDYQRSFCMLSIHHRGTVTDPGLVLALDHQHGAACTGVALRVADDEQASVLDMLRERELISSAYYEDHVDLITDTGQPVRALTYIVDRAHAQYCQFDLEQQAQIIARAQGGRGPNTEYLFNTAAHLAQIGIDDPDLTWLVGRVRALVATNPLDG